MDKKQTVTSTFYKAKYRLFDMSILEIVLISCLSIPDNEF